ncbi:MAG: histidinol-phosphatase HisJ family protein [Clostridia bacterium]|nr:histidinol-phosphatase HisJ family protein [Clostridia bacterium]
MFLADYHVHCIYSFDYDQSADCTPMSVCRHALDNGMSEIAFTDHYCVNAITDGSLPDVDLVSRCRDILEAKAAFEGKLTVRHGIELGQPTQREDVALCLLSENDFDFVIGSLHNNEGFPDFYYLDYKSFSPYEINSLWDIYLKETMEHIRWGKGRFHTLGHLNYLERYIHRDGMKTCVDKTARLEVYREIFRLLIENDIALELNTSGLSKGLGDTVPDSDLVRLYREVGGELFTVGSDAHTPAKVGSFVKDTYLFLESLGVTQIATFESGKLILKSIR